MQLVLSDPAYTDRLATFLTSLGRRPVTSGPDRLELDAGESESDRLEVELYLRVWRVLYPDADVALS